MLGDEEGFGGGRCGIFAFVLALRSQTISLGAKEEHLLRGHNVGILALPSLQYRRLQCAAVAERQRPRFLARSPVDGVQVYGGIQLRLSARQKHDAGTADGTPRRSAVTVASPICSGVYFLVQD